MSTGLARFPLLAELSATDASHLDATLERVELDPGSLLFAEGNESDALWLVVEGQVELTSQRAGSRGVWGPGRALGALGLVAGGPREATARAASRCVLLKLDRAAFERLVTCAPRAACRLALNVARESAATLRELLDALGQRSLG